jgi:Tfp pilus assembly protein PilF
MSLWIVAGALIATVGCAWAVAALVLKPREAAGRRRKLMFLALMLPAIGLRLYTATLGNNYDMISWAIVSDLLRHGQSFYAITHRYNYGPVWAYILRGLDFLSGEKGISDMVAFHVCVSAFLSLVDMVIASFLLRSHGPVPALIYMFCPVSVLISGYHGQFENFAVLLALLSWRLVQQRKDLSTPWLLAAAGLMGLSLAVKHVFFLFPVWLAFAGQWRRKTDALVFAGISYAIFCFSFLPWMFDRASRAGVLAHVFGYGSAEQDSLLRSLVSLVVPPTAIDASFWWSPIFSGSQSWFVLAMLGMMVPVTVFRKSLFHYYLLAVLVCSPALAEHYFVIPLIACCVFYRSVWLWIYMALASFIILSSRFELGSLPAFAGIRTFTAIYPLDCRHAVFWLLVFIGTRCAVWLRRAILSPTRGKEGAESACIDSRVRRVANLCLARTWFSTGILLATIILLVAHALTYPLYRSDRIKTREAVLRQIAEEQGAAAMEYLRMGDNKAAMNSVGQALSINARSPTVLAAAAGIHLSVGEVDKGLVFVKEALSYATDRQIPLDLGALCYRRGNYREAAQCFEQALRWAPADANSLNNLGACYMALGLTQEAEALFQKALAVDPSLPGARRNLDLLRTPVNESNPARK